MLQPSAALGIMASQPTVNWAASGPVDYDFDLFLSIAEIAGVFVGFGALISLMRGREIEAGERIWVLGVVTNGLCVLVAALIPVGLGQFGLVDRGLWAWSSGAYLLITWVGWWAAFRNPEIRDQVKSEAATRPASVIVFLVLFEVPIQFALALALVGVLPALAGPFYKVALVLNLFQSALLLAQLVYASSVRPRQ